jgi:hypothetical protein
MSMAAFLAIIDSPETTTCGSLAGQKKKRSVAQRVAGNRIPRPRVNTVVISGIGDVGVVIDRHCQITGLVRGGAADKSGRLHVGDILLRVNGTCTAALEYNRVVKSLRNIDGTLELKIMSSTVSVTDAASEGMNRGADPEQSTTEAASSPGPRVDVKSKTLTFDVPSPASEIQNGGQLQNKHSGRRSQVDGRPGSPIQRRSFVQLRNWQTEKRSTDTLHCRQQMVHETYCQRLHCQGSIMYPVGAELKSIPGEIRSKDEVIKQAESFLNEYYESLKRYVKL